MKTMKKHLSLLLALVLMLNALTVLSISGTAVSNALTLIPNSVYVIDASNGILKNVFPNTNAGTVIGNFENAVVYNNNDVKVADSETVGSGYTVRLYNGNSLVQSLSIAVLGDANGDGSFTSADLLAVAAHMTASSALSDGNLFACDANNDGSVNAADRMNMTNKFTIGTSFYENLYDKTYVLSAPTDMYSSYANALAGTNRIGQASAGTYYINRSYPAGYNGYFMLSTSASSTSGFWIKALASSSAPESSEEEESDEDESSTVATGTPYTVVTTINKYSTAADAADKTNAVGTLSAGTYYIYNSYPNGYNGMYNITTDTTGSTAGYWINPSENTTATGTAYVLSVAMPKYSTASDAQNKTNSTGTAPAGTYYVYNGYPNGYNGMYNLTTDPTGAAAGFWINPADGNATEAKAYALTQNMPKYANSSDAINRVNSTGTATAGTYYIYTKYPDGINGVYCLCTDSTGSTPSFWINPADAAPVVSDGKMVLVRPINKYSSANDALHQTNINGTVAAGTYYVYKSYPNGLNGMYNLTTDTTGSTAGFWVNPMENTASALNYDTVKAVWLSQYDLSSVYKTGSSQTSQSSFTTMIEKTLDAVKTTGFNTVFVQVRPDGDAFYPSSYYPPSAYVTGSYSKEMSYDPFAIIIEECRERAISVHAWINPLRLMSTTAITTVSSAYKIRQWYNDSSKKGKYIVAVDKVYYLNPGYAETRQLVIDGVTELCTKYRIDGVHFDDYFYPDGTTDAFDQDAFKASGQSNRSNFRRAVINAMVKGCYNAVKSVNSSMLFGISPAGNIDNNYTMLYADVSTWAASTGFVDYLAPQLYWGFENTYSPFLDVLGEWETTMARGNVKFIGALTLDKAAGGSTDADGTEWTKNKDVIKRQIEAMTDSPNFAGVAIFSLADFFNAKGGYYNGAVSTERSNFMPVLKALYVN